MAYRWSPLLMNWCNRNTKGGAAPGVAAANRATAERWLRSALAHADAGSPVCSASKAPRLSGPSMGRGRARTSVPVSLSTSSPARSSSQHDSTSVRASSNVSGSFADSMRALSSSLAFSGSGSSARRSVSPITFSGSTGVPNRLLATSATFCLRSVTVPPSAMVAEVPTTCR